MSPMRLIVSPCSWANDMYGSNSSAAGQLIHTAGQVDLDWGEVYSARALSATSFLIVRGSAVNGVSALQEQATIWPMLHNRTYRSPTHVDLPPGYAGPWRQLPVLAPHLREKNRKCTCVACSHLPDNIRMATEHVYADCFEWRQRQAQRCAPSAVRNFPTASSGPRIREGSRHRAGEL